TLLSFLTKRGPSSRTTASRSGPRAHRRLLISYHRSAATPLPVELVRRRAPAGRARRAPGWVPRAPARAAADPPARRGRPWGAAGPLLRSSPASRACPAAAPAVPANAADPRPPRQARPARAPEL